MEKNFLKTKFDFLVFFPGVKNKIPRIMHSFNLNIKFKLSKKDLLPVYQAADNVLGTTRYIQ